MRVARFYAPGDIRIEDMPEPTPGPGEVKIKVRACSTCGTDVKISRFGHHHIDPPRVMGHEIAGEVTEVGEGVEGWAAGDRVQVIAHKTVDVHGYYAVQMGAGWKHPNNVTKSLLGHFSEQGVSPKRHVYEFRVKDEDGLLPVGQLVNADWFHEGQYVDARSNTKGKGFAGVMKRHGFGGQDRSHGVSLTHRSLGSAGPSQGGGSRVYPGKKMAGNMGNEQNTVQNLKVLKVDAENGLVLVNGMHCLSCLITGARLMTIGSVSGPKGCVVRIQDAIKKPWPVNPESAQSSK